MIGEVLAQFGPALPAGEEPELSPLGAGNINDTWLVRSAHSAFVLQRLNPLVFPRPELVMANLTTMAEYLEGKTVMCGQRWENCTLLPTTAGEPFYTDQNNHVWRALTYIDRTITHQNITTSAQAGQVGWALGHFHSLMADLPASALYDTLPGFHILSSYLRHFDRIAAAAAVKNSLDLRFCLDFVAARRGGVGVLEQARLQGKIATRVVHGDPKAANVLFDAETNLAVSLIDLDTVGAGLALYDIGDCLRSCCNTAGEAPADPTAVAFDMDMCQELLAGYLSEAGAFLSAPERVLLSSAVRLVAFELGLRFLTDYLAGNHYFKVSYPEENLQRALVQFHLSQRVESVQGAIEKLVDDKGLSRRSKITHTFLAPRTA